MTDFVDLEISLRGAGRRRGYRVEPVLHAPGRDTQRRPAGRRAAEVRFPFERLAAAAARADPGEYGQLLARGLFAAAPVRDLFVEARATAAAAGIPLRLRIAVGDDSPELHALRWETLRDPRDGRFLACCEGVILSRFLPAGEWDAGPPLQRRLAALVVIAAPKDAREFGGADGAPLSPVDVAGELARAEAALVGFDLTRLCEGHERPTLENLKAHLRQGCDVLYLVGHGMVDGEGVPQILLEGEAGEAVPCRAADTTARDGSLRAGLADEIGRLERKPRLAVLASCQSAGRDAGGSEAGEPSTADRGVLAAMGPRLVAAGVPAVLAMQGDITMETVKVFVPVFLRELRSDGVIDRAAAAGRAAAAAAHRPDWWAPALFMCLESGRLFAPSPVRAALERMLDAEPYDLFAPAGDAYYDLPVEVVHLKPYQDLRSFDPATAEATAGIDVLQALGSVNALPRRAETRGRLVVLVGEYGSNSSTQLKRMGYEAAVASLQPGAIETVLPVYVNLAEMPARNSPGRTPLFEMILAALRRHWDGLDAKDLDALLGDASLTLRILFDSSESLDERARATAYREIGRLVGQHPRHQYILVTKLAAFDPNAFTGFELQILLLQRLERRKIGYYLASLAAKKPWAAALRAVMEEHDLYDLAATPRFMIALIQAASAGQEIRSRSRVLQHLLDEAIGAAVEEAQGVTGSEQISRHGIRADVRAALNALAWAMQSQQVEALPLDQAFAIAKRVRGDREYGLEGLHSALLSRQLLASVGANAVRFAHRDLQSYCCACAICERPDRDKLLDDIASTLGRPTRLRWWGDTLVFACGLLAEDHEALVRFLQLLVYDINLHDAGQAFLAARCLSECGAYGDATDAIRSLVDGVTAALIWRLHPRNEPRSPQRSQAVLLLGQSRSPIVANALARAAYEQMPERGSRAMVFQHSNVRMAAMLSLLRWPPPLRGQLLAPRYQALLPLLNDWQNQCVEKLTDILTAPYAEGDIDGLSLAGLAALALGDLHVQLTVADPRSPTAARALDALAQAFFAPKLDAGMRWAVTYAIASVQLTVIEPTVMEPYFSPPHEPPDPQQAMLCRRCMAYLIGLVRWQDPRAHVFLVDDCMTNADDPELIGIAIDALRRLGNRGDRKRLERIALGDFKEPLPAVCSGDALVDWQRVRIRRKAIDALGVIGDRETLTALRRSRDDPEQWGLELEEALYFTSEEIYWRENWDRRS